MRWAGNRTAAVTASAVLLLWSVPGPARAQSVAQILSGKPNSTTTPSRPSDALNRTTPRKAIYSFLEACHSGNLALAAEYLDLRNLKPSQHDAAGPELAKELGEILDRDPHFEVEQLSDSPEGNQNDGLSPNRENLLSVRVNAQTVSLQLERVNEAGNEIWLVAADSVGRIPELKGLTRESTFERQLPAPLVKITLLGTPVWVWLALVLLGLILAVLSRLLSRIVVAVLKRVTRRYSNALPVQRLEQLTEPLRLMVSVVVFRACMEALAPSALLRYFLIRVLAVLLIASAASLFMRLVDLGSDQWMSRFDPKERALSYSVASLAVRFIKICIFCIAILVILADWGFNTNAVLAGFGVGGLAIALAAQKTIENLFGGISVITDRPVLIGDFCKFGSQTGTVEDIGLRSTRIRTLDRTLVTVPNSQFSTMTLENYSRRDRMWFHPTLHLRRDTNVAQIRAFMDRVAAILKDEPKVDASGVPLRFTGINDQAYDIDIFAYVQTADYNEYLQVQSELLLKLIGAAAELKVGFAVPFQESITPAPAQEPGPAPAN